MEDKLLPFDICRTAVDSQRVFSAAGTVIHLRQSFMAVFAVLPVPFSLIGDHDNLFAASGPRCYAIPAQYKRLDRWE